MSHSSYWFMFFIFTCLHFWLLGSPDKAIGLILVAAKKEGCETLF